MKFEMPTCGGCKSCELACSYHHTGKFEPSASSLKVIDKGDFQGFKIELLEKNEEKSFACNGCKGLDEPLCLEWCKEKDALKKILDGFMKTKEK